MINYLISSQQGLALNNYYRPLDSIKHLETQKTNAVHHYVQ